MKPHSFLSVFDVQRYYHVLMAEKEKETRRLRNQRKELNDSDDYRHEQFFIMS